MIKTKRDRIRGYAALPLCLLACAGMYFVACAISDSRFDAALDAAEETVPQVREGETRFNALTLREQRLYDVIDAAMEVRDTETERVSFVPTDTEFTNAFYAVLYDRPQYCDVLAGDCYLTAATYSAAVTLAYEADGEEMRQVLQEQVQTLCASLTWNDAENALALHAALTAICTVSATDTAEGMADAYDALIGGSADGFGYALAYAMLCETAGIPCEVVTGSVNTGTGDARHAWNAVTLDGVTGYTDVMWDDAPLSEHNTDEDAVPLSFHGYYNLSLDEMSYDHMPDGTLPLAGGDTATYYEAADACVMDAASLAPTLQRILTDARAAGDDCAELYLSPALGLSDYQLEEHLQNAIAAANAVVYDGDVPALRAVNRIYHAAQKTGPVTIRLFYEEEPSSGEE